MIPISLYILHILAIPISCYICELLRLEITRYRVIIKLSNETKQHTRATAKSENEVAKAHQRHSHNIGQG